MTFSDEHKKLLEAGRIIKESNQIYDGEDALAKYALVLAYNRFAPKNEMIKTDSFLKRCRLEYCASESYTRGDGEFIEVYQKRPLTEEETATAIANSDKIIKGIWEADRVANPEPETTEVEISPDISEDTDVLSAFLEAFHVNSADIDDEVAKWVLLSFLGSREITGDGLHLKVSAETGQGKTYSVNAALFALPQKAFYKGAFTDRALIYDKTLLPGTLIKLDEAQGKSEVFESVLKEAISSYQEGVLYRTVIDKAEGTAVKQLPARLTFILLSPDSYGDEQSISRFVPLGLTSRNGKSRILTDFRLQKRMDAVPKLNENDTVLRAREILSHFSDRTFRVSIPWAKDHIQYNTNDQRVQEWFECTVMYNAILNYKKRDAKEDEKGVISITATKDDFDAATKFSLFHSKEKTEHRFVPSEIEIIKKLKENGFEGKDITRAKLVEISGKSDGRISQIMHGRDKMKKDSGGLMAKVGITEINIGENIATDQGTKEVDLENIIKHVNQKAYRIPLLPNVGSSGDQTDRCIVQWRDLPSFLTVPYT